MDPYKQRAGLLGSSLLKGKAEGQANKGQT